MKDNVGMSENQIDVTTMKEIIRRIVDTIRPEKIILFGSRARGDAHPGSDIDLLIITDSTEPRHRRSAPLYGALSDIMIPMDIVAYNPEEVKEWEQVRQAFVTTAIHEGKVLYENPD